MLSSFPAIFRISFLFIFFNLSCFCQSKFTISGFIKDSTTGESLPGASIFIKEKNLGTASNMYGFFSLSLPDSTYNITIEYVGYKKKDIKITLENDISQTWNLIQDVYQQEEVVSFATTTTSSCW